MTQTNQLTNFNGNTSDEEWTMFYAHGATIHYKQSRDGIKIQGTHEQMERDPVFKQGVLKLLSTRTTLKDQPKK